MSLSDVSVGSDPFDVGSLAPVTISTGDTTDATDPLTPLAPSPPTGGTYLGSNTTQTTDWFGLGIGTPINSISDGTANPLQSDPLGIGTLSLPDTTPSNPAIAGNGDVWGSLAKNVTSILGSVGSTVGGILNPASVGSTPTPYAGQTTQTVSQLVGIFPILAVVALFIVFLAMKKE